MIQHIGGIVETLVNKGLTLSIGSHAGRAGFWCAICDKRAQEECSECGNYVPMCWKDSGHGLTVISALNNAVALREVPGLIRTPDDFKEI